MTSTKPSDAIPLLQILNGPLLVLVLVDPTHQGCE
jgi:hypothetical protein